MVVLYSVKINGTEIGFADGAGPNYILEGTRIDLNRENINGNRANVYVSSDIVNTITPVAGDEIRISRGTITSSDTTIFIGNIKKIQVLDDGRIMYDCWDLLQKLKYDIFTTSYDRNIDPEAGELSEIFKDIAEQGGFSVSRVRSGSGSSDVTVDKFISNNNSRLDRLNLIQKILGWVFYYDYNAEVIRLEPKGFVEYPSALNVGTEILNVPIWEEDIESVRNKITVEGARQLDTRIDTFSGDGTTTEFELTFEPESVETTVGGTLQTLGIQGANEGFDYTLDKDRKTITFETAPPSASNNIVCTYTTLLPTPVIGQDDASIALYNVTQQEVFEFDDIRTVADAEVRLNKLLEILSVSEKSTSLFCNKLDVEVGNKISFINSFDTFRNGEYIVQSKTIEYGLEYDIIKIGTPKFDINKVFETIDERLRLLEKPDEKLGTILRQIVSLVRSRMRIFRKQIIGTRASPTDSFILGHTTLGRLRTDLNFEADCSNNTNHGTWNGTGIDGSQFETVTESGGVFSVPVQRLGCGVFNGTDNTVTSTGVSETGITSLYFFMIPDTNSRDIIDLGSGNVISLDGSGNITTSGLTNVTITEESLSTPTRTFVYIEFDAITVTNPTVGFSTTYYDGKLDEFCLFDITLTTEQQNNVKNNLFYSNSDIYTNCKLWWSFDNPRLGDRRTNEVEFVNTIY